LKKNALFHRSSKPTMLLDSQDNSLTKVTQVVCSVFLIAVVFRLFFLYH
jgi:hypothetical protein